MKIYFDNVDFSSASGPNSAVCRIAKQLACMGHTIADHDDYDIALVVIEPTYRLNLRKPFVQRLDGIWSKPQEFHLKNNNIRSTYDSASGIVFQSEFDKKMITKWFGEPRCVNHDVILNGIDNSHVVVSIPQLFEMRNKFDKIFVCSASWHPQKRLRDNVEFFKHVRQTQHPNSCLVVLGQNPDHIIADRGIFYTGQQSEDTCLQVFATADWMIHLARADHCPNVCIQSISQNTPVICVDVGGTVEIVKNNGVILIDSEFEFELEDYDDPPRLIFDNTLLPDNRSIDIDCSHLDIRQCALSYESLFERVLNS